jgi:hypothetical protein
MVGILGQNDDATRTTIQSVLARPVESRLSAKPKTNVRGSVGG